MKKITFTTELLAGHKDHAVEVPFDPGKTWGLPAKPLWRGRKGHTVSGTLNRTRFEEGYIVPRAKKFFLLIDKDLQREAQVEAGDSVKVSVAAKQ